MRLAAEFGLSMLLEVTAPDTTAEARTDSEYVGVTGVRDLL